MSDDGDSEVVIRRFSSWLDAQLALSYLESLLIRARLEGSFMAGIAPHLDAAMGGVRLIVPLPQAARVDELLRELDEGRVERADLPGDD